ncbi:UNVERIFIED_CONTAM: hypothetical protein K2H54_017824 [Gekko kuhli]
MGVGGCLVLPWRCVVVLCLRLLFLVPAGVPVRSGDATFPKAMDNVTVRQGESAILRGALPLGPGTGSLYGSLAAPSQGPFCSYPRDVATGVVLNPWKEKGT